LPAGEVDAHYAQIACYACAREVYPGKVNSQESYPKESVEPVLFIPISLCEAEAASEERQNSFVCVGHRNTLNGETAEGKSLSCYQEKFPEASGTAGLLELERKKTA
jgi:hypothetical protein